MSALVFLAGVAVIVTIFAMYGWMIKGGARDAVRGTSEAWGARFWERSDDVDSALATGQRAPWFIRRPPLPDPWRQPVVWTLRVLITGGLLVLEVWAGINWLDSAGIGVAAWLATLFIWALIT